LITDEDDEGVKGKERRGRAGEGECERICIKL
jgi:hypothetical protein